jgi:sec-independent protein translocase protein TatB
MDGAGSSSAEGRVILASSPVFGISFGEALLLVVIGLIVVGPRDLPSMMRSLGRNISKLRRTATDLRAQSGIDEILQNEGIHREIQDLQKLATGRILEVGLHEPLLSPASSPRPLSAPTSDLYSSRREPPRRREYPPGGPDCFDAIPEDAALYQPANPSPQASENTGASKTPSPAPRSEGAIPRGELPPDDEVSAA